jgi:hypothetical protein
MWQCELPAGHYELAVTAGDASFHKRNRSARLFSRRKKQRPRAVLKAGWGAACTSTPATTSSSTA